MLEFEPPWLVTLTVPCWCLATMVISIFLPQQHSPKVWGVPLVPWLPSLSIATNVFLMGSLKPEAFLRFGICTVVMLIYYLIFGLMQLMIWHSINKTSWSFTRFLQQRKTTIIDLCVLPLAQCQANLKMYAYCSSPFIS